MARQPNRLHRPVVLLARLAPRNPRNSHNNRHLRVARTSSTLVLLVFHRMPLVLHQVVRQETRSGKLGHHLSMCQIPMVRLLHHSSHLEALVVLVQQVRLKTAHLGPVYSRRLKMHRLLVNLQVVRVHLANLTWGNSPNRSRVVLPERQHSRHSGRLLQMLSVRPQLPVLLRTNLHLAPQFWGRVRWVPVPLAKVQP